MFSITSLLDNDRIGKTKMSNPFIYFFIGIFTMASVGIYMDGKVKIEEEKTKQLQIQLELKRGE